VRSRRRYLAQMAVHEDTGYVPLLLRVLPVLRKCR